MALIVDEGVECEGQKVTSRVKRSKKSSVTSHRLDSKI